MRSFALLLLGAGLLWLVLRQPTTSEAGQGEGRDVPAGVMLAPEDSAAADRSTPSVADERPRNAAAAPNTAEPGSEKKAEASLASEVSRPVPEAPSAPKADSKPADEERAAPPADAQEAAIAERLVHAPEKVEELLQRPEFKLTATRRELVRTLALAARGDPDGAARLAQRLDLDAGISGEEADFVKRISAGGRPLATSAGVARASWLVRATSMRLAAAEAGRQLAAGDHAAAVASISDVVLEAFRAPWPIDAAAMRGWIDVARRAQASHRWRRDAAWPGLDIKVEKGDSLISIRKRAIAQREGLVTCTGLIARANGLSNDVVHPGQTLRIPTDRVRMLVDLDGHWAVYLMGDEVVDGWEVGVGKPGSETRAGDYRVGDKRREPMWFPRGQAPVPFGDPRNPLGTRWIEFETPDGTPTHIGFHGTNEPDSIGGDTSQGCLRMRNPEVEALFEILPQGTAVLVQP